MKIQSLKIGSKLFSRKPDNRLVNGLLLTAGVLATLGGAVVKAMKPKKVVANSTQILDELEKRIGFKQLAKECGATYNPSSSSEEIDLSFAFPEKLTVSFKYHGPRGKLKLQIHNGKPRAIFSEDFDIDHGTVNRFKPQRNVAVLDSAAGLYRQIAEGVAFSRFMMNELTTRKSSLENISLSFAGHAKEGLVGRISIIPKYETNPRVVIDLTSSERVRLNASGVDFKTKQFKPDAIHSYLCSAEVEKAHAQSILEGKHLSNPDRRFRLVFLEGDVADSRHRMEVLDVDTNERVGVGLKKFDFAFMPEDKAALAEHGILHHVTEIGGHQRPEKIGRYIAALQFAASVKPAEVKAFFDARARLADLQR